MPGGVFGIFCAAEAVVLVNRSYFAGWVVIICDGQYYARALRDACMRGCFWGWLRCGDSLQPLADDVEWDLPFPMSLNSQARPDLEPWAWIRP